MATLRLKLKNKILGAYQIQNNISFTIGRREDNDVIIEDRAVSGHHAKIDSLGNRFVLTDLQSKNGSFVNEQLVNSQWLKHGDVISIGDHSLVFEHPEGDRMLENGSDEFDDTLVMDSTQHRRMMIKSTSHKSINVVRFWDQNQNRGRVKNTQSQNSKPAPESKASKPEAVLTYLAGGNGQIELSRKITTIGKHPTSDIVVKGLLMDQTAVTISKEPAGFYLNYIGGQPKPKINDNIVKAATLLCNEDIIEIGSTRLQFKI